MNSVLLIKQKHRLKGGCFRYSRDTNVCVNQGIFAAKPHKTALERLNPKLALLFLIDKTLQ